MTQSLRPAPQAPGQPQGGTTRRVAVNSFLQAGAQVIGSLGQVVLYAVMAREAGVAAFGDFTSAASLSLLVMIAAFGMDLRVTRLVARGEEGVAESFWGALLLKTLFGVALLGLVMAVAVAGPYGDTVILATGLLGLAMLVELAMLTPHAVFRGIEDLRPVASALIVYRAVLAGGGVAALLAGAGVEIVAAVWVGSVLVALGYSLVRLRSAGLSYPFRVTRRGLRAVATDSFGLGLAGVFGAVLSRLDIVILGIIKDSTAVAHYGGAYRLIESALLLTGAFAMAAFPSLTRLARDTAPTIGDATALATKATIFVTAPVAVACALYAEPILVALYGSGFSDAGTLLELLGPVLVIAAACSLVGYVLTSQRRQRPIVIALAGATLTNIVMNLILIPPHGAEGAAIAMIVTMAVMAALYLWPTMAAVGRISVVRVTAAPLAGAAAMAAVGLALGREPAGGVPAVAAFLLTAFLVERRWHPLDAARIGAALRRRPLS